MRHILETLRYLEWCLISVNPQTVEILHQDNSGAWIPPIEGLVTIKKGTMSGIMCKVVVDGTPTEPDIDIVMADSDARDMFAVSDDLGLVPL